MRLGLILLAVILTFGVYICVHTASEASWVPRSVGGGAHSSAKVDFATDVKPILEKKCMPCHFSGGTMYKQLPFDHPETVKKLGIKLFTRIKDENDRRPIRDFLNQQ